MWIVVVVIAGVVYLGALLKSFQATLQTKPDPAYWVGWFASLVVLLGLWHSGVELPVASKIGSGCMILLVLTSFGAFFWARTRRRANKKQATQ